MSGEIMRIATLVLALLVATRPASTVAWQSSSLQSLDRSSDPTPLYQVSFKRGGVIAGMNSTPSVKLPFKCTDDGTIFVTFEGGVSADSGLMPPLISPEQFVSITPPDRGQVFRLDQIPELFVSGEIDHSPSDSGVVFLVRGSRENKPEKRSVPWGKEGAKREYTVNAAAQHLYIVSFSLGGQYKRTAEIDDSFSIENIAEFPLGVILAFGFDTSDYSPKLAMLKQDGTLLKFLEIPKGDAPVSLLGEQDSPHRGVITPSELVSEGHSILIIQKKSNFPILEVSEGDTIRAIHPKLMKGQQIEAAIPSDRGLYVLTTREANDHGTAGVIYEVSPEDGSLLRRFELTDRRAFEVACIHDGKFLSLDHRDGKVVPLFGTAEPANVGQRESQH
jgi:hypothetical protein